VLKKLKLKKKNHVFQTQFYNINDKIMF